MNEFELIRHYFKSSALQRSDVPLGIGDDCALVAPKPFHHLAVTTDTMVSGVHFDERLGPFELGYKLMAVNLSDLASMGAEPCWISLALTLPEVDQGWLEIFSLGMAALAKPYQVSLIGGDTTRGPLSLTLTAQGQIPIDQALTRGGAQPGDLIYVSGHLGDARLALAQDTIACLPLTRQKALEERLFKPTPRVRLGELLREVATSCIDLSDGLAADLSHILRLSNVGAKLSAEKIPVSEIAKGLLGAEEAAREALLGGDDYELCFTVPADKVERLHSISGLGQAKLTCIGEITQERQLMLTYNKQPVDWNLKGFMHFG